MKRLAMIGLAALSFGACESEPIVIDLSDVLDPDAPNPPSPEFTVRGTVYYGVEPLRGVDAWVDLFVEDSGSLVIVYQRPVGRDSGAWDVAGWGYLCASASSHKVRARYVIAGDTLQTNLQPVWATPPTLCLGELVADDIVIPDG